MTTAVITSSAALPIWKTSLRKSTILQVFESGPYYSREHKTGSEKGVPVSWNSLLALISDSAIN